MRLPIALILLIASVSAVGAAPKPEPKKEQTFEQRLLEADRTKAFDINQMSPFRHSPGTFQTKGAASKSFGVRAFSSKDFTTKSYAGSKGWWGGDFKFAAKDANTKGKYDVPNATKQFATKDAATKAARESDKTMDTRQYAAGQREYLGPEAQRIHKQIDAVQQQKIGWKGRLEPLSVEDVRDLLNTNK